MLQFWVKYLIPACLLLSATVAAQTAGDRLVIERYNTQNGLTHAHVYQVFQDTRGFVWLVTGDALMLYDGGLFMTVMRWNVASSPQDSRLLFEDDTGRIWLRRGKTHFLVDIRSLEVTDSSVLLEGRVSGQIDCVVKGGNGIVSLITDANRVYLYNILKDQVSSCDYIRPASEYAIGSGETVWFFDENTQLEDHIKHCLNLSGMGTSVVDHVMPGPVKLLSGSRLGGINGEGLVILNPDNTVIRFKIPGHRDIYKINISLIGCTQPAPSEEGGKYCWVYFQGKLLRVNTRDNKLDDFTQLNGLSSLPTVFDVLKDRDGAYWIATSDGLVKTYRIPDRFNKYVWQDPEITKSAPKNSCRGITQARNGDIYLSYSSELYKKGEFEPDFSRVASAGVTILGVQAALDSEDVWLGSGYLLKYDNRNKKTFILERPAHVKLGDIWSFYEEKDRVWLGYSSEPLIYDKKNNLIIPYYEPGTSGDLKNTDIYQITPTPGHDSLWMATNRGLFLLNRERNVVVRYHTGSSFRFPCDNIRHINQTAPDQIWMATACGLVNWQPLSGKISLISTQDGLPNSNLYAVYPDDYGFLWMSSDMGIIQYHIQSGRIRHFTVREGTSSNEFNRISHLKARDGTLYFGSVNGVTAVHPNAFASDFFPGGTGGLVLLSARAQGPGPGETVDLLPYYLKTGTIQIQPDERFIKLHFAAPNYSAAGTVSYYYKIEGVNDTWQQINSPDVMFPQLPGGHYRIYVRAGSISGTSPVEPITLEVDVLPYFYEESWFFALMIGLAVILGAVAWRIRVKYLLERQLELEGKIQEATSQILADKKLIEAQMDRISNISEEKNRFFVNITHELRTPLTLITAPLESIQHRRLLPKKESEMLSTALRNSRQLLMLINDLLLLSRDEPIKSADIRVPVEIVPVIEDIIRLHSYSAAQKGIRFHFVRGILDKPVVEGDEKLFRRVLENIVANAVKYSDGAGKVTVSVTGNNDTVTVSVADTGRGIDSADMPHIFERYFQTQRKDTPFEGGTGIGLSIAREIMDLFGGNIRVESEVGKGSIFHLDFPVPEQLSAAGSQTGVVMQSVRVNTPLEALKRRKIYVVDDNPEIGKFLSDTLGDDFDITVFFSGNSLLNHLKDSAVPDLLICDLMMPGMNGFELMEHIRNCAAYDSMKILVLTAMTSSDTEERALSCGASAVLWKPFSLDDMKHRIIGLFSDSQMPDVFTPLASDLSEEQMEWLGQLNRLILSKMTAADFTVEWLAQNMHVSRSTLFRELNKLTGQTPNEYIQGIRLEYARRLFESGNVTSVAEVLAAVGLRDKIHFSRIYRDRFGKSPHTYIR